MILYIVAKTVTNKYQNLSEQFPRLITDLTTVCFKAFHKADPDKTLTFLVYEVHYFHTLQVEASDVASAFPPRYIEHHLHWIANTIVAQDPQQHRLEFTGQHYAIVVSDSMDNCLSYFQR